MKGMRTRLWLVLLSGFAILMLMPWAVAYLAGNVSTNSFRVKAPLPTVRDWSLKGPGGSYGITENGYILIQTKRGFEHHTQTWIWFGPLGRSCVPVSAPVAALGLTATTIAFFALGFLWLFKLNHEKQTV
jgi:hypothetical protein